MKNDSQEPEPCCPNALAPTEPDSPALATDLEDSYFETRRLRHDGWDGPAMALFCQALAEIGVVTEACRACGKSAKSAYALRQREPLFARAWESALSLARERLADDLLARSLKGSCEQIMRDGCIVGERHAYDNKLAFAILRRLDRRAEFGATFRTPPADRIPCPVPAVSGDWQLLLDALSEERKQDAAILLTPLPPKSDEGNEGNNPPIEGVEGDDVDEPYVPKRVWQEYRTDAWRTDFPPPPDFDGEEKGAWEEQGYSRTLTAAELAAVTAGNPDEEIITLEQDEADRDAFFAALATPIPPPCLSPLGGADLKAPSAPLRGGNVGGGEVSASADGGVSPIETPPALRATSAKGKEQDKSAAGGTTSTTTTKPQQPPKSEPPLTPNRCKRGASNPGETP